MLLSLGPYLGHLGWSCLSPPSCWHLAGLQGTQGHVPGALRPKLLDDTVLWVRPHAPRSKRPGPTVQSTGRAGSPSLVPVRGRCHRAPAVCTRAAQTGGARVGSASLQSLWPCNSFSFLPGPPTLVLDCLWWPCEVTASQPCTRCAYGNQGAWRSGSCSGPAYSSVLSNGADTSICLCCHPAHMPWKWKGAG